MTAQTRIILDNPPLEQDRWADQVFERAALTVVDNQAITRAMAKDPESRQALLDSAGAPVGSVAPLAPHYLRALEQLYGDAPRLGLFGTAWLDYLPETNACVVDWSEIETRAAAAGVPEADGEAFRQQSREFVRQRTRRLPPERLLELPPDTEPDARAELALGFLRQLDLA